MENRAANAFLTYSNLTFDQVTSISSAVETLKSNHKETDSLLDLHINKNHDDTYNICVNGYIGKEFQGKGDIPAGKYTLIGRIDRHRESDENNENRKGRKPSKHNKGIMTNSIVDSHADFATCACCQSNRDRSVLYVLESEDGSQTYNVGSSCVKDVLELTDVVNTMDKISKIAESYDHYATNRDFTLDPHRYAACVMAVNHFGLTDLGSVSSFKAKVNNMGYSEADLRHFEADIKAKPSVDRRKMDKDAVSFFEKDNKGNYKKQVAEWALYLYKQTYIEGDSRTLNKTVSALTQNRETLTGYLSDDNIKAYVNNMFKSVSAELAGMEDKMQAEDHKWVIDKINNTFFDKKASHHVTMAIGEYVANDSGENRNKVGISAMEHGDIYKDTGFIRMSGPNGNKFVNAHAYNTFVPIGNDTRNITELINGSGEIVVKQHDVELSASKRIVSENNRAKYVDVPSMTITVPDIAFAADGSLPNGGILLSDRGDQILSADGMVHRMPDYVRNDPNLSYERLAMLYSEDMTEAKRKEFYETAARDAVESMENKEPRRAHKPVSKSNKVQNCTTLGNNFDCNVAVQYETPTYRP